MKLDAGFTLIEILITMAILGLVAAMAVPSYTAYLDKTNAADVASDFAAIELKLETYFAAHGQYPATLVAVGKDQDDPWGNALQYLDMASESGDTNKRKNASSQPINTDYDLYSKGPDGLSALSVTATISLDDVIRADNGGYIGIAEDY